MELRLRLQQSLLHIVKQSAAHFYKLLCVCCYLTVNRCCALCLHCHTKGDVNPIAQFTPLSDWTFATVVGEMKRRKSGRIRRLSSGFNAGITHSLCCAQEVFCECDGWCRSSCNVDLARMRVSSEKMELNRHRLMKTLRESGIQILYPYWE